jgi:hypothetical protein
MQRFSVFVRTRFRAIRSNKELAFERRSGGNENLLWLPQASLFFIPDTAKDPTHLNPGEELWVLATIPRKGPPRPIALGVKKAGETDIRRLATD